jgi:hypothetical protein
MYFRQFVGVRRVGQARLQPAHSGFTGLDPQSAGHVGQTMAGLAAPRIRGEHLLRKSYEKLNIK